MTMNENDQRLGMDAQISRRDFLGGASLVVVGSMLSHAPRAEAMATDPSDEANYPPIRTGLRGSHPGSFEVAHALRDGKDWTNASEDSGEKYDLIVIGGGLSGLATAWFYRRETGPDSKILVIENHDDFGGHAKRNEFHIDGKMLVDLGGAEYLEDPSSFPESAQLLLRELGVDTALSRDVFDHDLYSSLNLRCGIFFDEKTFGRSSLTAGKAGLDHPSSEPAYVTLPAELSNARGDRNAVAQFLDGTPLSDIAKEQVLHLFVGDIDYLPSLSREEKIERLRPLNYIEFLRDVVGANKEVINLFWMWRGSYMGSGNDMAPALAAFYYGMPGAAGLGINVSYAYGADGAERDFRNDFHFPDGNASVARLLVRDLVPNVAPGNSMNDIISARFDYSRLDDDDGPVRIRLNATAVDVRHVGDPKSAEAIDVTYVKDGQATRIRGKHCVMACYHSIVPYLCPELPQKQKAALGRMVRMPLVSTNVLLSNWRSLHAQNVFAAYCPGSYFSDVRLTYPLRFADYESARSPDEPITLHMYRVPLPGGGVAAEEQFRAGRRELLATTFEVLERKIRIQLDEMLSPGGFNVRTDIRAITVNRWPHGYTVGINSKTGRLNWFSDEWPDEEKPWIVGRKSFGRIFFASSDAQASAMTESAIDQAWRATNELVDAGT